MIIQGNDPFTGPSFSLSHRVRRQLWGVVWLLLFRPSPRPFHAWRNFLLRAFGATLGRHVHIYPSVKVWAPWNLIIGSCSGIGDGANIYCMDKIEIGDFVAISQGAHLCGGTHDYNSPNLQLIVKPIVVQSHAWVCAEAFVHAGVIIPAGAVIGARAVVTKSLSTEWAVYAGNPAKLVALRTKHVLAD
jgi:putative colanic acid biosynthesis acetyltransferase WcaF